MIPFRNILLATVLLLCLVGCLRPMRPRPPIQMKPHTFSGKFLSPVKKARVVSPFGKRKRRWHTGVDLKSRARGEKTVRAARLGYVVSAGRRKGYGKMITIKHEDGAKTRYAHLKKILVRKGQAVQKGQKIGIIGKTGRATGPHLHFEILTPQGRFVNPTRYISGL